MIKRILSLVVLLALAGPVLAEPALVPWPKSATFDGGSLQLTGKIVAADPKLLPLAKILSADIERMTGAQLPPAEGATAAAGDVLLKFDESLQGEAHKLDLGKSVTITGGNYRAVTWGTSTLLQAMTADGGKVSVPTGSIADDSDIKFRSAECDIARKWHPIANLYELVDLFSFYKINHIMLHLNDHGMFTFGSEVFPELPLGKQGPGKKQTDKHFYTKAELKDLVAYAQVRGVSIIPELEMPGHSDAPGILPKIFGTKDAATGEYKGGPVNVLREDTVAACSKLLDEVMDVFTSSDYVSVGCDEVNENAYLKMSEYADFKAKHPEGAVDYFIKMMNETANAKGKKLLVYGRGGPSDVLQMPWSGNDNELASRGFQIIPHNSGSVTQHLVTFQEPPYNTMMLYTGFQGSYQFDFTADKKIAPENLDKVYGIQTLTWQHWHFMHFFDLRRTMASISENAWNYKTHDKFMPFEKWRDTRWTATNAKLDDLVFPVKVNEQGLLSPGKDIVFQGSMTATLSSSLKGKICYVKQKLDYFSPPPLPTAQSQAYDGPIKITEPTVIYAALFNDQGQMIGHGTERRYFPITAKVMCAAYDGAVIARKQGSDMPNLSQPSATTLKKVELPATLEALEKVGVEPIYRFPLGRLTYQPSYEGVYFQGWLLVEEGKINVPAAGEYEFGLAPVKSSLYIDGKQVASINGEGKNAAKTGEKVNLTAGEHSFQWLAATGSKFNGPVITVRQAGQDEKQGKPLDEWIQPINDIRAAN